MNVSSPTQIEYSPQYPGISDDSKYIPWTAGLCEEMIPGQLFAARIPRNLQIDLRSNYALGFWTSEALGMNWRLALRQSKHISPNGALP